MDESEHCKQRYEYCSDRMAKLEKYLEREICLKIKAEIDPLRMEIDSINRAVEVKANADRVDYGNRLAIISLIVSCLGFLSMFTFIVYRVIYT